MYVFAYCTHHRTYCLPLPSVPSSSPSFSLFFSLLLPSKFNGDHLLLLSFFPLNSMEIMAGTEIWGA
jgi:hypothetical protein